MVKKSLPPLIHMPWPQNQEIINTIDVPLNFKNLALIIVMLTSCISC